ncbi:outer membrane lipoprotein carrier protein LolA [bacterium]|nr:outer membrane lipoprotein carrier protein LolA [bacterium]
MISKRSILIIALIWLAFSFTANAASPGAALKKIQKKYNKLESLRAEFREVFEWEMTGENSVRSGSIIVTNDKRFYIDTPEQLLVSDGSSVFRYNRVKSQVIIEPISEDNDQILPSRLLMKFADGFSAESLTPLPVAGKEGYRLDLKPDNEDEMLTSAAIIWFSDDDQIVHRLKLIDLNGNSTTYFLNNIVIDQPVKQLETSFEIPKDVEVFDLR